MAGHSATCATVPQHQVEAAPSWTLQPHFNQLIQLNLTQANSTPTFNINILSPFTTSLLFHILHLSFLPPPQQVTGRQLPAPPRRWAPGPLERGGWPQLGPTPPRQRALSTVTRDTVTRGRPRHAPRGPAGPPRAPSPPEYRGTITPTLLDTRHPGPLGPPGPPCQGPPERRSTIADSGQYGRSQYGPPRATSAPKSPFPPGHRTPGQPPRGRGPVITGPTAGSSITLYSTH